MRAGRVLSILLLTTSVAAAKPRPEPAPAEPATADKAAAAKPASSRPVAGDRRRIVGILDVRVDGVPKEIAAQFQTNLEAHLDSRAYWLAPMSRMHEMLANSTKWTEGCLVGSCLGEVKIQTGAELVLLAALTGSGTSFGYVVTLVRTDSGRMLSQEADRCDVCTVNEALTNATLAAVKLVTSVPDTLPDEVADNHAAMDLATHKLEEDKNELHHHHKAVGIGLTITGLAVAAGGAALYFAKDHSNAGLATAAAGGGLAIGGLLVLSF